MIARKLSLLSATETIAASGNWTSPAFGVASHDGAISYHLEATGSGATLKMELLVGPMSDGTYQEPGQDADDGDVITGKSIGASGVKIFEQITGTPYANAAKLKVSETGGSVAISLTKLDVYLK